MNVLDLIIFIPILIGFVFGLFKGLIKELTSLAAIVLGILGAKLFEPQVSALLLSAFDMQPATAKPVSYLILFVVIAILLLLVANMIDKLFSAIALGGLNKLLGGIFGGLKLALIVSVLLNVFAVLDARFSFVKKETKENSIAYEPMMKLSPTLWEEAKVLFIEDENEKD